MRNTLNILLLAGASLGAAAAVPATADTPLKDVFGDKFLIGAAINDAQAKETDTKAAEVVKHHFNSIVAENVMKCQEIHPEKGVYFWDDADRFVSSARTMA